MSLNDDILSKAPTKKNSTLLHSQVISFTTKTTFMPGSTCISTGITCTVNTMHIVHPFLPLTCWCITEDLDEACRGNPQNQHVRQLGPLSSKWGADILRIFAWSVSQIFFAHVTPNFLTLKHRRHGINFMRNGLYHFFSYANKFGE